MENIWRRGIDVLDVGVVDGESNIVVAISTDKG